MTGKLCLLILGSICVVLATGSHSDVKPFSVGPMNRAGLVISWPTGYKHVCVTWPASVPGVKFTTQTLLMLSKLPFQEQWFQSQNSHAVCSFYSIGCPPDTCLTCATQFWNYWHLISNPNGGVEWQFSDVGIDLYQVKPGAVEGFGYGNYPTKPVVYTFNEICHGSATTTIGHTVSAHTPSHAHYFVPTGVVHSSSPTATPQVTATATATATANANAPGNRAGLVVQYKSNGKFLAVCVPFATPTITGDELLEWSGIQLVETTNGLVCEINGVGCNSISNCTCECPNYNLPSCTFWNYWHWLNGAWSFSNVGTQRWTITNGAVDGWAWGPKNQQPDVNLPISSICPE